MDQEAIGPGAVLLGVIKSALREDTIKLISQQFDGDPWGAPLGRLVSCLDPQTLAIIIRDLEDEPNLRGHISEQDMLAVIKTCRTEGEQRLGQRLFDAMIAEYE